MNKHFSSPSARALSNIPNTITVSRIVIAAIFPFCPESLHFALILTGLATEFLDGFLARLFNWTSYLGQVLDPIADKLFVLSVSLTWVWLGKLTVLQWLLLGLRDFGVLFIFLTLLLLGKVRSVKSVKARFPSKLTTAFQYLVFIMVLFGNLEYLTPLAIVTAAIGLAATLQYIYLLRNV
ncbi:MAG: CDP-alcohol phosphatidyltransferase family protein [Gammaproteobacteria bacterium]|nr:CDP-alcohol phosphatidyltransferase family protein [Gammaproteobacteria bacterium]